MENPLIPKLERRDATLSDEEKRALDAAIAKSVEIEADTEVVRENDEPSDSKLLIQGWACRYNVLADGRRQIVAFHVPGDFVDLHSFTLKRMDHYIRTLTPSKFALVPHEALRKITEEFPHVTRLLWLSTLIDAAILRQWLTGAGQRTALERAAHILCELFLRLQVIGQTDGMSFHLPVTQAELSDALGLSPVHMNRTIQELRSKELIKWRGEVVEILDWGKLQCLGDFDPVYLNLEDRPR
jgi:CRP-like cAMP-binding protein